MGLMARSFRTAILFNVSKSFDPGENLRRRHR